MKLATIDKKRRLVMPRECPPSSRATVEQFDSRTWIVRLQPSGLKLKRVLFPVVNRLGPDREWDKLEAQIARGISRRLKEPEEQ